MPPDDSERLAVEILAKGVAEDPVAVPFHGRFYCPIQFDNSVNLETAVGCA